jgi:hypothetical protein
MLIDAAPTRSNSVFERIRDRRAAKADVLGQVLGTKLVVVLPRKATKIAFRPLRRGTTSRRAGRASQVQARCLCSRPRPCASNAGHVLPTAVGENPPGSASAIGSRVVTVR